MAKKFEFNSVLENNSQPFLKIFKDTFSGTPCPIVIIIYKVCKLKDTVFHNFKGCKIIQKPPWKLPIIKHFFL